MNDLSLKELQRHDPSTFTSCRAHHDVLTLTGDATLTPRQAYLLSKLEETAWGRSLSAEEREIARGMPQGFVKHHPEDDTYHLTGYAQTARYDLLE